MKYPEIQWAMLSQDVLPGEDGSMSLLRIASAIKIDKTPFIVRPLVFTVGVSPNEAQVIERQIFTIKLGRTVLFKNELEGCKLPHSPFLAAHIKTPEFSINKIGLVEFKMEYFCEGKLITQGRFKMKFFK